MVVKDQSLRDNITEQIFSIVQYIGVGARMAEEDRKGSNLNIPLHSPFILNFSLW